MTPLEAMEPLVVAVQRRVPGIGRAVAEEAVLAVLAYREERFTPLNSRVWPGAGEWVQCGDCPLDAAGFPVFHHRRHHVTAEAER